jgi:hypothetical protein
VSRCDTPPDEPMRVVGASKQVEQPAVAGAPPAWIRDSGRATSQVRPNRAVDRLAAVLVLAVGALFALALLGGLFKQAAQGTGCPSSS